MKKALVAAHERSGTHFLINAISMNFKDYHTDCLSITAEKPDEFMKNLNEDKDRKVFKSHHHHTFFDPILEELHGTAHVFCVVREGKDVLASTFNHYCKYYPIEYKNNFSEFIKGKYAPEFITKTYQNGHSYEDMVDKWKKHVQSWLLDPRVTIIQYEELLNNFEKTLQKIAYVLKQPMPSRARKPNLSAGVVQPRTGVSGDWVNWFRADDLKFFNEHAAMFENSELGYDIATEIPVNEGFVSMLDIKATPDILNGYCAIIEVDEKQGYERDIINIFEPLPWQNSGVGLIRAWDILQYLDYNRLEYFLNELHRVLCQGGIVSFKVPEYPSAGAISDPKKQTDFTPYTFRYFQHLFDTVHIEATERPNATLDRGMKGSFDCHIFAELKKTDPIMNYMFTQSRNELAKKDGFVTLKNVTI